MDNGEAVRKQFEDEAVARFSAIENPTDHPQEAIDALVDIKAARGLTASETRMLWGFIQLVVFKPVVKALREGLERAKSIKHPPLKFSREELATPSDVIIP